MLDLTLLAAIAAAGLQVLPLPNRLRWLLSPRIDVDRFTLLLMPEAASTWRPLSLDPSATALAVALVAASALMFWSCRQLSGRGRALGLVHVVAAVGLAGAVAAILQRGVDPTRIYGLWLPMDAGARPFGPFVNRNHFATWLLMALPLTAGAAAAMGPRRRAPMRQRRGRRRGRRPRVRLAPRLDPRCARHDARRAGVVVFTIGACWWHGCPGRLVPAGIPARHSARAVAAMAVAVVLAAAVVWTAPVQPILARVRETLSLGAAGRTAIWADARTVARTFPITGTGLGTFERSMLIYQTTDRRRAPTRRIASTCNCWPKAARWSRSHAASSAWRFSGWPVSVCARTTRRPLGCESAAWRG